MPATQLDAVVLHIRKLACKATTGSLPDGQLLERFTGQRDESAFAAIVHRHGPMVLGVCRSVLHNWHDAEDAFQATFLVLARKAASINHPGALGSWLYGVAFHVAIKAQARAARRRDHERRKTTMPVEDPVLDMTVRELRRALYEELERMPQNLKQPLVLCYLESMTHAEAARELGWSKGKLRGRLNRGREVLRARMARRGLAFSGGLFATVLAHNVARAAVPAALAAKVVETGLAAIAGSATANVVSAEVSALANGVMPAAVLSKLKLVAMLSLALVFAAAGAGVLTFRQTPAAAAEDRSEDVVRTATPSDKATPAAAGETDKLTGTVEVSGRVLDPEGKPVAGARLYCQLPTFRDEKSPADPKRVRAMSSADGSFQFHAFRRELIGPYEDASSWFQATLAAAAPGYGPGWVCVPGPEAASGLTLKLVKDDVPINGRVVDLEGRPIAGVTVRVLRLSAAADENLERWLGAVQEQKSHAWTYLPRHLDLVTPVLPEPTVKTLPDGRFQFRGIGRERLAELAIQGPTIENRPGGVYVMTRASGTIKQPINPREPEFGNFVYYGATFDYAAGLTKPIFGTVRDKDTGKPLAGVTIKSRFFGGTGNLVQDFVRTSSDAEGNYRLLGMPAANGHQIMAMPGSGQPYFPSLKHVPDSRPLDAVRVDFVLKRGQVIRGRVTDQSTGRPVRGARVFYGAFLTNPHLNSAPGFWGADALAATTADDGSFTVIGFPGRGLLAVKAEDRFSIAAGADQLQESDKRDTRPHIRHTITEPLFMLDQHHAFKEVNPGGDGKETSCDIALDPGRSVTGSIIGPDGQPLAGVRVLDLKLLWTHPEPLPDANFTATALDPREPRWHFFHQKQKQLGAAVLVRGDETKPLTIRLEPCGSVTGRLLEAGGKPWPDVEVLGRSETSYMSVTTLIWWYTSVSARTDRDGRFRVDGLIPKVKYNFSAGEKGFSLTLAPGESKDVGPLKAEEAKNR